VGCIIINYVLIVIYDCVMDFDENSDRDILPYVTMDVRI